MDGSHFDTRYPFALRFKGIGQENLAGYEKNRKPVGGDIDHALKYLSAPNRILIGSEDRATEALAEIAKIKAQTLPSSWKRWKSGTAKTLAYEDTRLAAQKGP